MSKVYLVQHLCAARHCITARAFEEHAQSAQGAIDALRQLEKALGIEPGCGLCGSEDLRFEVAPTKYNSMAEAAPHLQKEMLMQLAMRELFERERSRRN